MSLDELPELKYYAPEDFERHMREAGFELALSYEYNDVYPVSQLKSRTGLVGGEHIGRYFDDSFNFDRNVTNRFQIWANTESGLLLAAQIDNVDVDLEGILHDIMDKHDLSEEDVRGDEGWSGFIGPDQYVPNINIAYLFFEYDLPESIESDGGYRRVADGEQSHLLPNDLSRINYVSATWAGNSRQTVQGEIRIDVISCESVTHAMEFLDYYRVPTNSPWNHPITLYSKLIDHMARKTVEAIEQNHGLHPLTVYHEIVELVAHRLLSTMPQEVREMIRFR